MTLYPFQTDTIAQVEARTAAGTRRLITQLPTGAGKTVIASEIIRRAVDRDERALFLVHRRELTKQSSAKLFKAKVDHGIV
jgi:DNA repair protein RadD